MHLPSSSHLAVHFNSRNVSEEVRLEYVPTMKDVKKLGRAPSH